MHPKGIPVGAIAVRSRHTLEQSYETQYELLRPLLYPSLAVHWYIIGEMTELSQRTPGRVKLWPNNSVDTPRFSGDGSTIYYLQYKIWINEEFAQEYQKQFYANFVSVSGLKWEVLDSIRVVFYALSSGPSPRVGWVPSENLPEPQKQSDNAITPLNLL